MVLACRRRVSAVRIISQAHREICLLPNNLRHNAQVRSVFTPIWRDRATKADQNHQQQQKTPPAPGILYTLSLVIAICLRINRNSRGRTFVTVVYLCTYIALVEGWRIYVERFRYITRKESPPFFFGVVKKRNSHSLELNLSLSLQRCLLGWSG